MDIKHRPNHNIYIRTLRKMGPEARLNKAFELTKLSDDLLTRGLRTRFSSLSEDDLKRKARQIRERCHNNNY